MGMVFKLIAGAALVALMGCEQSQESLSSQPMKAEDAYEGTYLSGVRRFDMASQNTGIEYTIRVQTPPKYDADGEGHPVLLVMDGAMMFATAVESAGIQASTGETQPVIVVGVSAKGSMLWHNTRRQRDYSGGTAVGKLMAQLEKEGAVTAEQGGLWPLYKRLKEANIAVEEGFGGADQYLSFLADELLPKLHDEYNIDRREIGLMGHSMGGGLIAHALLRKDTPFTKFIAGTFATVWYTPEEMVAYQAHYENTAAPRKVDVFYGYGGIEVSDFPGSVEGSIQFLEDLKATDPSYINSLLVWNFEREQHGSVVAAVLASGIHHLWGTGLSYSEAAKNRNNDEWK